MFFCHIRLLLTLRVQGWMDHGFELVWFWPFSFVPQTAGITARMAKDDEVRIVERNKLIMINELYSQL